MLVFASVKFGKGGALVKNPWLGFQKDAGGNLAASTSDPGSVDPAALFLPPGGGGGGSDSGGEPASNEMASNVVASRFTNVLQNPDGTSAAIQEIRRLGILG